MPEFTQIPFNNLITGRWYIGRGRNCNIGLWDGKYFLVICEKFNEWRIKREPYFAEEHGCFQPFVMVNEGQVVEPFGKTGWDAHYGQRMEFPG